MDRRTFVGTSTLLAAGTLLDAARRGESAETSRRASAKSPGDGRTIGVQVGAVSFVDEGTEAVLDRVEQDAGVNTLFLATFTYGRGIGGRQPRGSALPDHGTQEYDDNFRGGNFATPHPQYYNNTAIAAEKAPDHPGYDVVADVLPRAHRRGMKVICWYEDVFRRDVPGFDRAVEIDVHGRRTTQACLRNPHTRNFWLALTEDYLRSYDVDGLMWGSERQGPLDNALGANHGGLSATIGCFCPHCLDAARRERIDADRAREGFLKLEQWATALRGGQRPADGAFVTFWRMLLKYPEMLAWERLWMDGLRDTYRDMHHLTHAITPAKGIGWHIWHNNSFSPFYRAEQNYAEFGEYSDFLKVVAYNNCGGPRMGQYIRNVTNTLFADLTPQHALDFTYGVQQYQEASIDRIAQVGLSSDYVLRETKRAIAGSPPRVKIWPGIDVDIPTGPAEKKTQPDDVFQAVTAAFKGGAHGVVLSRKYSEMSLANLRAAGRAVR
ncbi:MAG: hypothetical protein NVS4B3_19690 [Gemmatimonadaceae bacterium]